jgi:hypothetical protein
MEKKQINNINEEQEDDFKGKTTVLCLTAITIIGLLCQETAPLGLWVLYGIYKWYRDEAE